jgi:hypothetical protein
MKEQTSNERVVKVVGIDLAKRSFHVYGVDERGQRVISRTFSRTRLKEFMAHLSRTCSRTVAAWLGLVPRQHSTGGRERLLGISQRGDVYLCQLLIHGTRAVLRWVERKDDPTSRWAMELKGRRHPNVMAVALANKIARIAYVVMTAGQPYDPAKGALIKARVGRGPPASPHDRSTRNRPVATTEYLPPQVAKSEPHGDGMKDQFCIPENLIRTKAGSAETARLIRTGMRANSIRARGSATAPQHDAGYMAATSPSAEHQIPSCIAGRTIYV